jgi:hypothetical protein
MFTSNQGSWTVGDYTERKLRTEKWGCREFAHGKNSPAASSCNCPTHPTEKIMMTAANSDRQFCFPSANAAGRISVEGENGFSLRETLAHTEVRELSFAEFRAAMEQMRRTNA